MTMINLTPSDSIQSAIDDHGGPGVEFILTPGDYRQEIVLRGSRESNNGVYGAPLRIVLQDGARLLPFSDSDDTITFQAARYVTFEGEGPDQCVVVGPDDSTDRRQAIHIHSSPKQGRYPTGLVFRGLTVEKRGGDAIKHSEGIGCVFEDLVLDGEGGSNEESLLDANKFLNLTLRNVTMRNLNSSGLILKGGGIGAIVDGLTVRNVEKGVEAGGYEGSGYWAFLIDQLANGGADLHGDPIMEAAREIVRRSGGTLQWGARWVTMENVDIEAFNYPFRTIDAWDVEVTGILQGPVDPFFTSSAASGRGSYVSSNVTINGELVVPVRGENRPVSEPGPDPEPTPDPEPAPEPTPDPEPRPDPSPEPIVSPTTYQKGDAGKDTISVGKDDLPDITFEGFDLDWDGFMEYVIEKADDKVIIDLRSLDGVRLLIKGKDVRSRWMSSVTLL